MAPLRVGLVCPVLLRPLRRSAEPRPRPRPLSARRRDTHHTSWRPARPTRPCSCDLTFTSAGAAVPVPYNGSVARVNFGPRTAARVRRWLRRSALRRAAHPRTRHPERVAAGAVAGRAPIVATFHTATPRSRTMAAGRQRTQRLDRQDRRGDGGLGVGPPGRGRPSRPRRHRGPQRRVARRLRAHRRPRRSRHGRLAGWRPAAGHLPGSARRTPQGPGRVAGGTARRSGRRCPTSTWSWPAAEAERCRRASAASGPSATTTRRPCCAPPTSSSLRTGSGRASAWSWSRRWPAAPMSSPPICRPSSICSAGTARISAGWSRSGTRARWPRAVVDRHHRPGTVALNPRPPPRSPLRLVRRRGGDHRRLPRRAAPRGLELTVRELSRWMLVLSLHRELCERMLAAPASAVGRQHGPAQPDRPQPVRSRLRRGRRSRRANGSADGGCWRWWPCWSGRCSRSPRCRPPGRLRRWPVNAPTSSPAIQIAQRRAGSAAAAGGRADR